MIPDANSLINYLNMIISSLRSITPLLVTLLPGIVGAILVYGGGWLITYLWPNIPAKILFKLKRDPEDTFDIESLIYKFLKYDDWKRLEAKNRLRRMFQNKMRNEFRKYELKKWEALKDTVECEKFTEEEILQDKAKNMHLFAGMHNDESVMLPKKASYEDIKNNLKDKLPEIKEEYEKRRRCYFKELPVKKTTVVGGKDAVKATKWKLPLFFDDEPMIKDKFLNHNGFFAPKERNLSIINALFDNIMLYVDYPHKKSRKEKLIRNLALGLSNGENSNYFLERLIKEVEKEINRKNYDEKERIEEELLGEPRGLRI